VRNFFIIAIVFALALVPVFAWWFQVDLIWVGVYAAISLVSAFTVPLSYNLFGFDRADQLKRLALKEQQNYDRILNEINQISADLMALGEEEASKQTARLLGMVDDYHKVVTDRFKDSPMSVSAHADIAQRVQTIVVQNLTDLVAVARSISGIDREELEEARANSDESEAIVRRIELHDNQRAKISEIIETNRTMLTELAETVVEVANIQKFGETEQQEAVQRLRELADRAKKFSV